MTLSRKIPLPKAIAAIVLSTLLFSGGAFSLLRYLAHMRAKRDSDPENQIQMIVQTGDLKTIHLAELMGLSKNRSISIYRFNAKEAEKKLLACPLIESAHVKTVKPHAISVDYQLREPIALIYDYDNTAIDAHGHLFPIFPFFSPKKLPQIYLGLKPFDLSYYFPSAFWQEPLSGEYYNLAIELLDILRPLAYTHNFEIKRIDVAKAFSDSLGKREIVLYIDNHLLRLNPKTYRAQLFNYLNLRDQLIGKTCVVDLRLESLAYIDINE